MKILISFLGLLLGALTMLGQPSPVATTATTRDLLRATNALEFRSKLGFVSTNMSSVTNYAGNGAAVTNLNADELRSGTVPIARLSGITTNKVDSTFYELLMAGGVDAAEVAAIMATNNSGTATTALNLSDSLTNWINGQIGSGPTNGLTQAQITAMLASGTNTVNGAGLVSNAVVATTATNAPSGLPVADIVMVQNTINTNTPGWPLLSATAFGEWELIKKIYTKGTLTNDSGGLRCSTLFYDGPMIRVLYAGYTNPILSGGGVNSGGDIYELVGTSFDTLVNLGPVIRRGASGQPDSGNIGGIRVKRFDTSGTNYAYYFASTNTAFETGRQTLCAAYSTDGTNWTKYSGNPIKQPAVSGWSANAVQGVPDMVYHGGLYHLFYCAMNTPGGDESVGHATSATPFGPWTDDASNPVVNNPSGIAVEPNVIPLADGQGWLMMCGAGLALSRDLNTWSWLGAYTNHFTRFPTNGVLPGVFGPGTFLSPMVFPNNGGWASLFDDATSIFVGVPLSVETRTSYTGDFGGNGAGITNLTPSAVYGNFTGTGTFLTRFGTNANASGSGDVTQSGQNNFVVSNNFGGAVRFGTNLFSSIPGNTNRLAFFGAQGNLSNTVANANQFNLAGGDFSLKSGAATTNLNEYGAKFLDAATGADVTVTPLSGGRIELSSSSDAYANPTRIGENIEAKDLTAHGTLTATNANVLGPLTAGSITSTTANAGSFYPTNTYTITNGVSGDWVIPAGKVTSTNISANITVGGFSGIDQNYWRGGFLRLTNGTATDYKITFFAGSCMATNSFVLGRDVWCSNRVVTIISHGVGFNTTNIAAASFYPTP